jgi:hypothetical protein
MRIYQQQTAESDASLLVSLRRGLADVGYAENAPARIDGLV